MNKEQTLVIDQMLGMIHCEDFNDRIYKITYLIANSESITMEEKEELNFFLSDLKFYRDLMVVEFNESYMMEGFKS